MDIYKHQLKFDSEKELKKELEKIEKEEDPETKEEMLREKFERDQEKKLVMESLVAKIERLLFYNMMNAIPRDQGYLFSFLLGIIHHLDQLNIDNR